jgi:hypothetical protein
MQDAWPRQQPLPTSILFNGYRLHVCPAGWQEPVRADQYRQLVFNRATRTAGRRYQRVERPTEPYHLRAISTMRWLTLPDGPTTIVSLAVNVLLLGFTKIGLCHSIRTGTRQIYGNEPYAWSLKRDLITHPKRQLSPPRRAPLVFGAQKRCADGFG